MRAVLERDFLAEVSRPRFFWFRTLAAALVATVVLLMIADQRHRFLTSPDRIARDLFLGASFTLLSVLALLTPASVVGAVLDERLRDTLPLVLATPCTSTGFAAAKGIARALTVLGWALAALVPLTTVILLGGITGKDVGDVLLLGLAAVLELAGWSIWISGRTRRVATAAVLAYLLPALRWAVTILLAVMVLFGPLRPPGPGPGAVAGPAWVALATTPLPSCLRIGDRRDYDRFVAKSIRVPGSPPSVPAAAARPTVIYLAFSAAVFLLGILLAGRRLRTEAEPRTSFLSRFRWARKRLRAPPGEGNPMTWKEGRLLNTAASRPLYYIVLAVLVVGEIAFLVTLAWSRHFSRDTVELAMAFTSGHCVLLSPIAALAAAASFAHEKSTGSLDLLRVTRLEPREIARGKTAGAFRATGFLGLVPALHLLGACSLGLLHPAVAAAGLLALAVTLAFWIALGIAAGILAFRVRGAVALAISTYAAFVFGVPILAITAHEWWGARDFSEWLLGIFPPAHPYMLMEAAARQFQSTSSGDYVDYQTWWNGPPSWQTAHGAAVVNTVLLAVASVAAYRLLPRLLAWRLGRESVQG